MMKKIVIILLIILSTGCKINIKSLSKEKIKYKDDNIKEVIKNMKIIIDNNEYIINLEENNTVLSLIDLLPQELEMNELNGNEKSVYLNNNLPVDSIYPKYINAGDVMLYGNNCLVIFYKSFETSYSYTKIGHIDNLPNLGNKNIKVRLEK